VHWVPESPRAREVPRLKALLCDEVFEPTKAVPFTEVFSLAASSCVGHKEKKT
jgi:hypothetical protein